MGEIVTVNFRGDQLYGFKQDDGVFVALTPICEAMGIAWEPQRKRLHRDPVLSEATSIMEVPFGGHRGQPVTCLKMELLNGWLFGIDSSRIKDDEVRERVILYQRECYGVLYQHFAKGRAENFDPIGADLTEPMSERRKLVIEARQTWGHVVAKQLWLKLGMPKVSAMLLDTEAAADQPELPGLAPANDRHEVQKAA
ncbi:phage antirepressor N-terminal domain-containing protein [Brevundimonas vesicularis]|jgi:hypothetical protein|uniref:Phage antirepressor N-terminal domain-containing protein n=1 Tax=Brevundimonas vesicularis TaxID=41276 RepID=A0ABU4KNN8_BREVE|nr:phage antirepressor N-terminal domain-containing protein [Brevundimonas vesicularis]MDX2334616.1 phage antirepressor N-terminal domain-containing protein [Brevundimonas vesicularis]